MSSSSSNHSGHAHPVASSSRSPLSASPREDDFSDDGLEIQDAELLADDPLHENEGVNGGYGRLYHALSYCANER